MKNDNQNVSGSSDGRAKRRSRKYTILMVPDDAHAVRQFKVSTDFLVITLLIICLVIGSLAAYIMINARQVQDDRLQILALRAQLENVTSTNIMLEADKEQLELDLREANMALTTRDYVQKQSESAAALGYIPSGLPIA